MSLIRRYPVLTFFVVSFGAAWLAYLILFFARASHGESPQSTDGLLLFPIMELSVFLTGVGLTVAVAGRPGLRDLFVRMLRWRVDLRWYAAAILLPPCFIGVVLLALGRLVSPSFLPRLFALGIAFGLVAGFFEETGWMGFAYPRLRMRHSPLVAGMVLGALWGLWHVPVVDSLGAASPHGQLLYEFFGALIAVLMAMRLLIAWVYESTGSVLLSQLMYASSTGSLVMLSPGRVSPGQEALWYSVYAAALWLAVLLVVLRLGLRSRRPALARI